MQLSLLGSAPKPKPKPVEPRKSSVCQCDGQLVEADEDGNVFCCKCGRRKP